MFFMPWARSGFAPAKSPRHTNRAVATCSLEARRHGIPTGQAAVGDGAWQQSDSSYPAFLTTRVGSKLHAKIPDFCCW